MTTEHVVVSLEYKLWWPRFYYKYKLLWQTCSGILRNLSHYGCIGNMNYYDWHVRSAVCSISATLRHKFFTNPMSQKQICCIISSIEHQHCTVAQVLVAQCTSWTLSSCLRRCDGRSDTVWVCETGLCHGISMSSCCHKALKETGQNNSWFQTTATQDPGIIIIEPRRPKTRAFRTMPLRMLSIQPDMLTSVRSGMLLRVLMTR